MERLYLLQLVERLLEPTIRCEIKFMVEGASSLIYLELYFVEGSNFKK